MKNTFVLIAIAAIFMSAKCNMSPNLDLLGVPIEDRLTMEDYESLLYYNQFRLGITRREAIKNMAKCTYTAGKLGYQIYTLIQAFQIQKIPGIIKSVTTCINTCQSFKYLSLTYKCGNAVKSAYNNLKSNFSLYKLLKDRSRIKTGIKQLRYDLQTIEKTCVTV